VNISHRLVIDVHIPGLTPQDPLQALVEQLQKDKPLAGSEAEGCGRTAGTAVVRSLKEASRPENTARTGRARR
jgi:hypothetical protein